MQQRQVYLQVMVQHKELGNGGTWISKSSPEATRFPMEAFSEEIGFQTSWENKNCKNCNTVYCTSKSFKYSNKANAQRRTCLKKNLTIIMWKSEYSIKLFWILKNYFCKKYIPYQKYKLHIMKEYMYCNTRPQVL